MKKIFFLFLFLHLIFIHSYSQDLENRIKTVEEKTKKIEDDYSREIRNTRDAVNETKGTLQKYTTEVEKLLKQKIETDDARFQRTVDVLKASSEFIKSASKSFRAIDVSLIQTSFLQDITKLNNPTNADLGFSLKEVIT